MKTLFFVPMVVALVAGCGSGVIHADCESSWETFCDDSILYQVDLCGNTVSLGQCEHGCNLEFNGCRDDCLFAPTPQTAEEADANTYGPLGAAEQIDPPEMHELPRIDPYDP